MRSVNAAVSSKLAELLTPIGWPVYSNYVPAHEAGEAYILISQIANTDASPKVESAINTTFQLSVITRQNLGRDDDLCNLISEGIYQILFPGNTRKLDLSPDFVNTGMYFVSENSDTLQLNKFISINRFITFRLHIFQH